MENFGVKSIEHNKPTLNSMGHEFNLLDEAGNKIGYARLEYTSHPKPIYVLKWIGVEASNQKEGNGREMLENINEFLAEKKIPGCLSSVNKAKGFYEKLGWTKYKSTNIYFFGPLSEEEKDRIVVEMHFRLKFT